MLVPHRQNLIGIPPPLPSAPTYIVAPSTVATSISQFITKAHRSPKSSSCHSTFTPPLGLGRPYLLPAGSHFTFHISHFTFASLDCWPQLLEFTVRHTPRFSTPSLQITTVYILPMMDILTSIEIVYPSPPMVFWPAMAMAYLSSVRASLAVLAAMLYCLVLSFVFSSNFVWMSALVLLQLFVAATTDFGRSSFVVPMILYGLWKCEWLATAGNLCLYAWVLVCYDISTWGIQRGDMTDEIVELVRWLNPPQWFFGLLEQDLDWSTPLIRFWNLYVVRFWKLHVLRFWKLYVLPWVFGFFCYWAFQAVHTVVWFVLFMPWTIRPDWKVKSDAAKLAKYEEKIRTTIRIAPLTEEQREYMKKQYELREQERQEIDQTERDTFREQAERQRREQQRVE